MITLAVAPALLVVLDLGGRLGILTLHCYLGYQMVDHYRRVIPWAQSMQLRSRSTSEKQKARITVYNRRQRKVALIAVIFQVLGAFLALFSPWGGLTGFFGVALPAVVTLSGYRDQVWKGKRIEQFEGAREEVLSVLYKAPLEEQHVQKHLAPWNYTTIEVLQSLIADDLVERFNLGTPYHFAYRLTKGGEALQSFRKIYTRVKTY